MSSVGASKQGWALRQICVLRSVNGSCSKYVLDEAKVHMHMHMHMHVQMHAHRLAGVKQIAHAALHEQQCSGL